MPKSPSLEEMLKAGVHFGHRTSKRQPKMDMYIFAARDGVHIIDLQKTEEKLQEALKFLEENALKGGSVLFVGTKKQAKKLVKDAASTCSMPYVSERWLGGTFTNYKTIKSRVNKLIELEAEEESGELSKYTKKEQLLKKREAKKLKTLVEGIKKMNKIPEVIFIIDIKVEKNALREAKKKGVKIVAITDTNVNPEEVDYPIPANDDAIKSIELILGAAADTVKDSYKKPKEFSSPSPGKDEPGKKESKK